LVIAFHSVSFRWVWASTLAFSGAAGMLNTALAWTALGDAGAGFGVGLIFAARMLPNLVFGLAAGTLADRSDRTRQVIAVSLLALPLMLALSRVVASGGASVWLLAALSFAVGCLSVFDVPARQALVMDVVPREDAATGLAVNALGARICMGLGALGAGLLISAFTLELTYLTVAATYLLTALLVAPVRAPKHTHLTTRLPSFREALMEGARLVVDVPRVRMLTAASVACEVFGFSYLTAVPFMARDVISAGVEGLGTMTASVSVGATLSVLSLSLLPARVRREPVLGTVFVLFGVALIGLGQTTTLLAAAVVLVVVGACTGAFDLLQQTLLQLAVPEAQRGRAIGVWVLGIGSAPVGHLEMGALVSVVGAPTALLINGSVVVLAAATLLARAPIFRVTHFPRRADALRR
jgi:MFS family permease